MAAVPAVPPHLSLSFVSARSLTPALLSRASSTSAAGATRAGARATFNWATLASTTSSRPASPRTRPTPLVRRAPAVPCESIDRTDWRVCALRPLPCSGSALSSPLVSPPRRQVCLCQHHRVQCAPLQKGAKADALLLPAAHPGAHVAKGAVCGARRHAQGPAQGVRPGRWHRCPLTFPFHGRARSARRLKAAASLCVHLPRRSVPIGSRPL